MRNHVPAKRSSSIAALAILLGGTIQCAISAPSNQNVSGHPSPSADCEPGQIVVELHKGAATAEVSEKLRELNARIVDVSTANGQTFALLQVDKPEKNFGKAFSELNKDKSHFDRAQTNNRYYPDGVTPQRVRPSRRKPPTPPTPPPPVSNWPTSGNPNDPNLASQPQLGLHNVVPGQRSIFAKGFAMPINGAVTIGIIDTGVQGSATCFNSGQVLTGLNTWTNGNGNVDSDTGSMGGHGTFCASLMAARTNEKSGGAGILPGATILPVDCFGGRSSTDTFHIIKGIQYLQGIPGVKFVNLSVNGEPPSSLNNDDSFRSAAQAFHAATGGYMFNAAGNSGGTDTSTVVDGNVVVEAVSSAAKLASFSVRGTPVQLAGCGVSDGSTNKTNRFVIADGTSFAAPSVCAIAASIQYAKGLSPDAILALMKANSKAASNSVPIPDLNACITAP